jgi:Vanadium chloroperoxidase N-terminal domain
MTARRFPIILAVVLALSVGLTARVGMAPARAEAGDSVVLDWNQQALDAIAATKTGPTIAARALAVVHTAIYDAWAAYDPVAVDSRGRLRANPELRQPAAERIPDNKSKAVSFAAYAALVDLFPGQDQQKAFATQMSDLRYAIDGSDTSPAAGVGTDAARAVLDYRHQDGANQLNNYADYTGYKPVNDWNTPLADIDPDHWQPLCVLTDAGVKNGHAGHAASRGQLRPAVLQAPDLPDPVLGQGQAVRPHLGVTVPRARALHLSGAGWEAQWQVRG